MMNTSTKKQLREQCRQARNALTTVQQQRYALAVSERLAKTNAFQDAQQIASYIATDNEVETHKIHERCWQTGKKVALPIIGADKSMRFAPYTDADTLITNKFNIPEPQTTPNTHFIELQNIHCMLIPLVGFDKQGNRIGFGGGYYDRYLQHKTNSTICIGLAYEVQKIPSIIKETWDISMDIVITEEQTYHLQK